MDALQRLAAFAAELPETARVDVEAWEGEPTFRVRTKTFVFADPAGGGFTVKLPKDEAEAIVATDRQVVPAGYGLGRHGWVKVSLDGAEDTARWDLLREWVRTSYRLVAPKRLAATVD